MVLWVYSALLAAVLVVGAPWWLARMATSGRYRAGLGERLGLVPAEVREAAAGRQVVWLHAVSVGEVMAATELVRELRRELPGWVIAVSTTTETGQALARERFGEVAGASASGEAAASPVFYLPLDFGFIVRRYVRALRPRLVVLMESELWPNLMNECERAGVALAVVNTRVSDRSLPRYLMLKRLWRPLLAKVDVFLAQSEENAQRLKLIGAPEERVRVSGNLKYDLRAAGETAMTRAIRERLPEGARVVVAGSVLEGEEAMLLSAWRKVVEAVPNAVMVLAPRRKERFAPAAELAAAEGFAVVRASEVAARGAEGDLIQPGSVVLLDTIGDLASVYSLGRVAFVGGSLVSAGGHNPLEPARFGVPVVMGGSCENFREIVEAMRGAGAMRVVNADGLTAGLIELLTDEAVAPAMGERGRGVFEAEAGATRRTVEALLGVLGRRGA